MIISVGFSMQIIVICYTSLVPIPLLINEGVPLLSLKTSFRINQSFAPFVVEYLLEDNCL